MLPEDYQEEEEGLLSIDINEVVNTQIKEKIKGLENDVKRLTNLLQKKNLEVLELKEKSKNSLYLSKILDPIREKYKSTTYYKDENGKNFTVDYQKYELIITFLYSFYKIPRKKWFSKGNVYKHLAVLYHDHKPLIIELLTLFEGENSSGVKFIEEYVLPRNWSKEEVLEFLEKPHSCTNGCYEGNHYWLQSMPDSNIPYSEILLNKLFLEDDEVFQKLLSKAKHYTELFFIYKYQNLTSDYIKALGEVLIELPPQKLKYDSVSSFIVKHRLEFNTTTLDYLFSKIEQGEERLVPSWFLFPIKYKMKYLSNKPFQDLLHQLLHNHNIGPSQKEEVLREWIKQNGNENRG